MTVKKGLASMATSDPMFSNVHIQNALNSASIAWVPKCKTLLLETESDEILTDVQKSQIYDALNTVSYLNIGRYFLDLERHTINIINGSLGEPDPNDGNTGDFLEHLNLIDSIQSLYFSIHNKNAGSTGKSVDDFVGSLRGTLLDDIQAIKEALTFIDNNNLSSQTDYETALQELIDFINTLDDSTFFIESTFNTLLGNLSSASSTFDIILNTGHYSSRRNTLITNRNNIVNQIISETNNLGSIRTYTRSLSNIISYQSLASNSTINDLIVKSSTNTKWKDYFENYSERFYQINPLFDTLNSEDEKIDDVLALRGLPDVTQYLDLDSVAQKALRDDRIKTRLGDSGKTSEDIIKESCVLLGINITGKSSYSQSSLLLKNLNDHDREIVRQELNSHMDVNTNS